MSKMFKMGNGISATRPSKQITSLSRNTPSHRPTQRQTQVRWARLQRPSLGLSLYQKRVFINPSCLTSRVSKKQRMFDAQVPGHEKHQEHLKCWRNKIFGHASSRPIIRALKKKVGQKKANCPAIEVRNVCPPLITSLPLQNVLVIFGTVILTSCRIFSGQPILSQDIGFLTILYCNSPLVTREFDN